PPDTPRTSSTPPAPPTKHAQRSNTHGGGPPQEAEGAKAPPGGAPTRRRLVGGGPARARHDGHRDRHDGHNECDTDCLLHRDAPSTRCSGTRRRRSPTIRSRCPAGWLEPPARLGEAVTRPAER